MLIFNRKSFIKIILIVACLALGGCNAYDAMMVPQRGHPAIDQINAALDNGIANNKLQNSKPGGTSVPSDVSSALLPSLQVNTNQAEDTEKRFDVAVNNTSAREFFLGLVKGTPYNVIVSPKITGNITLDLKNVTIPEVLEATKDLYGYQYIKTPYGYHILPAGLRTQIFKLNYLDVVRKGKSHTSVSSGQVTDVNNNNNNNNNTTTTNNNNTEQEQNPSSIVETETENDFWKSLRETMDAIIGKTEGSKVVINADAGVIVVTATPDNLTEVARYLDSLQSNMDREVLIDAKILEVNLYAGYQAGIDWNILGLSQSGLGDGGDGEIDETGNSALNDTLKAFSDIFTLKATDGGAFSLIIKLLSTQGNVQVLSSPRIATLNNQKAVIKVGQDEYFVTNISNTTVATTSTQNTQDVEINPFFSGIALDVTPQISDNGQVILHIHPIVSDVSQHDITYRIGNGSIGSNDAPLQEIPSALTKVRESDNIVRAQNGQVVVIGGLMEDKTAEINASTPFLSKVPIVGPLFRRANQQSEKSELVILLRPIVLNGDTATAQLEKARHQYNKLNKGYMFGSHPDVFGNLGEPSIQNKIRNSVKGAK